MIRIILRVLAILFLIGGFFGSAIAGYLLITPSEEDRLYEQKYKESVEKYEQAQAAKNPVEKERLLTQSREAGSWASEWAEGARTRRRWHQLGMGAGVAVILFSFLVFGLTFVGRKRS